MTNENIEKAKANAKKWMADVGKKVAYIKADAERLI